MFGVKLMNPENFENKFAPREPVSDAYRSSQRAAATCCQPTHDKVEESAKLVNVKNTLFNTGHHTTLQHGEHYLTYEIENIPISLVTFGLHLTHPFYNTSQCSGRYCTSIFEMDDESTLDYVKNFIDNYTLDIPISFEATTDIMKWLLSGIDFYRNNIEEMIALTDKAIRQERPNYPGKVHLQAARIAQEQLRCVLSTILPTRMIHTLNITALLSMNAVAWNEPLRALLKQMCDVLPEGAFKEFTKDFSNRVPFTPEFELDTIFNYGGSFKGGSDTSKLRFEPGVVVDKDCIYSSVNRKLIDLYMSDNNHRVLDTLFFNPHTNVIDTDDSTVKVTVEVPVSTFGQDQRHRMIKRSNPVVTGNFYVPPLVAKLPGGKEFCQEYMHGFNELSKRVSSRDMIHFIPYGATVIYTKEADVRAYLHSANKRLCWSAESAISKMEKQTIRQLSGVLMTDSIDAPCINDKCSEGKRFCGRKIGSGIERVLI